MKIMRIVLKDLKTQLSDRKASAIILVMPVVLMVILNFGLRGVFMGGGYGEMSPIDVAVVKQYDENMDNQRFERALSSGILAGGMDKETADELRLSGGGIDPESLFFTDFLGGKDVERIIDYRIEEEERAVKLLEDGEVSAVIFLPEGFVYDTRVNFLTPFRNNIDIRVLMLSSNGIKGQIVRAIVEAYCDTVNSVIIGKNVLLESIMEHDLSDRGLKGIKEAADEISSEIRNIRIELEEKTLEGRKSISSADYYAVAMMTMFILYAASHGGRMLLEEKENMTLQRMIVAGAPKYGILAGKSITVFVIALIQICIMTGFSYFALGVRWGGILPTMLIGLSSAFAVAGIGATLAAATYRAGNYKAANVFEGLIIQIMALLGGSFFPTDILPKVFQKLGFLSLNGTALKAYLKIMMGYGLKDIAGYIAVLLIIGAFFMALSMLILIERGGKAGAEYNQAKALKA